MPPHKPKITLRVHDVFPPAAEAKPGQITLERLKKLGAKPLRRPEPPRPAEDGGARSEG
jgi:hypothetical protein